jgi:hypothetical protein
MVMLLLPLGDVPAIARPIEFLFSDDRDRICRLIELCLGFIRVYVVYGTAIPRRMTEEGGPSIIASKIPWCWSNTRIQHKLRITLMLALTTTNVLA